MKKIFASTNSVIRRVNIKFIILTMLTFSTASAAKDVHHLLPIDSAVEQLKKHKTYDTDIDLYFKTQKYPVVERLFLQMTSKETSVAILQAPVDVCQKAFRSSIIKMQKKAKKLGAFAVVNIQSKYAGKTSKDEKQFQCLVGNLVGEVTLIGELVRFRKHG